MKKKRCGCNKDSNFSYNKKKIRMIIRNNRDFGKTGSHDILDKFSNFSYKIFL